VSKLIWPKVSNNKVRKFNYSLVPATPAVNVIPKQVCKEINYGYTYSVAKDYSKSTPRQDLHLHPF
jgi:hypothetical protein